MLIDLSAVEFTPQLLEAIPRHLAWRYRVLPISENADGSLDVALADPSDIDAIDSLQYLLKREIQLRLAEENQLAAFLLRLYPHGGGDQR